MGGGGGGGGACKKFCVSSNDKFEKFAEVHLIYDLKLLLYKSYFRPIMKMTTGSAISSTRAIWQ